MDHKERIVECRIQKVGDKISTIKTGKRSLNKFDDKRFHVNKIKSYPHDENLYLFKRDLAKKINTTSTALLIDLELHYIDNKDNLDNKDNIDNKDKKDTKDNKYNRDN